MTPIPRVDEEFRRRAVKPRDAWWAVLVLDHLVLPVLAVLVRVPWVTPMRLTMIGVVFGVVAVGSFGTGHLVLGAILFELRFFADCLDGKLARVRGLTSSRGAFVDFASDVVLISASMGALGWHLSQSPAALPLVLPAACTVACLVLFWLILYDLDHPAAPSGRPAPKETRFGRWRRHHRMVRLPGTIEVETGLLFLAPLIAALIGNQWPLVAAFVGAGLYYVVASVHLFVKLFRRTSPPTTALQDEPQLPPLAS
jgi:phosphatidylglycerophosphate synthase